MVVAPGGTRLRVRLLTLAVVDDLVALAVIAIAYTEHVAVVPLAIAACLFGGLLALRYAPAGWRSPAALLVGVGFWVALFEAGIDPVIAGLVVGLATGASGYLVNEDLGGHWLEELHEGVANAMLALAAIHVAGVIVASLLHRENLVSAMFTGYKRRH